MWYMHVFVLRCVHKLTEQQKVIKCNSFKVLNSQNMRLCPTMDKKSFKYFNNLTCMVNMNYMEPDLITF
jgi:hypothetical protein